MDPQDTAHTSDAQLDPAVADRIAELEDPDELVENVARRGKATVILTRNEIFGIGEDLALSLPSISHARLRTGRPKKLWGSLCVAPRLTTLSAVFDSKTNGWKVICTHFNESAEGACLQIMGANKTFEELSLKEVYNLSRGNVIPRPDLVVITSPHLMSGIDKGAFTEEMPAYTLGLKIARWAEELDIGIVLVVTPPRNERLHVALLLPFFRTLEYFPSSSLGPFSLLCAECGKPMRLINLARAAYSNGFSTLSTTVERRRRGLC